MVDPGLLPWQDKSAKEVELHEKNESVSGGKVATHKVGLVIADAQGRVLDADVTARVAIGLPLPLVMAAGRRRVMKALDHEGRPYIAGTIRGQLEDGVPFSTVRAFQWERGGAWHWFHQEVLALPGEAFQSLVNSIDPPYPLARGWECSSCDEPSTAVAIHNGRDLCLDCWVKTSGFGPGRK